MKVKPAQWIPVCSKKSVHPSYHWQPIWMQLERNMDIYQSVWSKPAPSQDLASAYIPCNWPHPDFSICSTHTHLFYIVIINIRATGILLLDLHVSSCLLFTLHLGVLLHLKYFEPFAQASIHCEYKTNRNLLLSMGHPTLFSCIKW